MFPFPSEEKSSETHHWLFWLPLVQNLKETSLQMQLCSIKSITIRSSLLGSLHFFCQFSNLFVPALDLEACITQLGSLWLQTPDIQIQVMLDSPWLKSLFSLFSEPARVSRLLHSCPFSSPSLFSFNHVLNPTWPSFTLLQNLLLPLLFIFSPYVSVHWEAPFRTLPIQCFSLSTWHMKVYVIFDVLDWCG